MITGSQMHGCATCADLISKSLCTKLTTCELVGFAASVALLIHGGSLTTTARQARNEVTSCLLLFSAIDADHECMFSDNVMMATISQFGITSPSSDLCR